MRFTIRCDPRNSRYLMLGPTGEVPIPPTAAKVLRAALKDSNQNTRANAVVAAEAICAANGDVVEAVEVLRRTVDGFHAAALLLGRAVLRPVQPYQGTQPAGGAEHVPDPVVVFAGGRAVLA